MRLADAPIFRLRGVTCRREGREVLSALDLDVAGGERVAVLGPNGAGKSTLLHAMVGLVRPDAGQVEAFGEARAREADFAEVRRRAGLLFQDPDDQLFCPTVMEDVAFGPLNLGCDAAEARARALSVLEDLGIAHLGGRVTHRLSGGEKRLVSLATILAMRPDALLLDEPTNTLDEQALEGLFDILDGLGCAMVVVTHDPAFVERLGCRPLVMQEGTLRPAELHRHPHVHEHPHIHVREAADGGLPAHPPETLASDHHHGAGGQRRRHGGSMPAGAQQPR